MAPLRWFRDLLKDYSLIAKNVSIGLSALVIAGVAALRATRTLAPPDPTITPIAERFGWAGEKVAAEAWQQVQGEFPRFVVRAADGEEVHAPGARVVLWQFSRAVNGGQHLPTLRQQVGSCVGHGACNAIWYLAAVQIAKARAMGDAEKAAALAQMLTMPYEPSLYGFGREYGNFRISGDGSVGSWQALACAKFGVVPSTVAGLPAWSTTKGRFGVTISFPGAIDRQWGRRPGVPQQYRAEAAKHLVNTVAQVSSYAEVRDAIAHGYPVTVASNVGFEGGTRVDRGKLWGIRGDNWSHQMCFIGVDDNPERPGCYCLNSWGADAHGEPADDAPPGGFWVDDEVVDTMARQGDSFAYSNFTGFPFQDLEWDVIRAALVARGVVFPRDPSDN